MTIEGKSKYFEITSVHLHISFYWIINLKYRPLEQHINMPKPCSFLFHIQIHLLWQTLDTCYYKITNILGVNIKVNQLFRLINFDNSPKTAYKIIQYEVSAKIIILQNTKSTHTRHLQICSKAQNLQKNLNFLIDHHLWIRSWRPIKVYLKHYVKCPVLLRHIFR